MAKLKEKILQALRNDSKLEVTLDEVSQSQENLLKNHSNPVFSNKDKNKILKGYTDLQDIGKSLYRYNSLQEHNYINDAQEEKEDIKNKVLKTGITYNKYIWHSENSEHTCDKCKELDGQVFDFYDEVPERPHPNCRCTVEIVEDLNNKTEDNDNTNKIPPQSPNHQPEQESPQQPTPQNPSQTKIQAWIKPCNGPITSGYGKRVSPVPGASSYHNGWDIGVPIGTSVSTIADGKVIAVGPARGYGNWVVIDHGIINGTRVTSEYGHLSSWNVSYGQVVKQGQVIAKSGNTGYSSGPHLHITIREGNFQGTAVNPSKYIKVNF
ncbi:peptidoglycan DD-metalloendopeptidase family protein [bacterium]|nr:peptidoglycan DD-metalloendopeptidase family protein [bacterium]